MGNFQFCPSLFPGRPGNRVLTVSKTVLRKLLKLLHKWLTKYETLYIIIILTADGVKLCYTKMFCWWVDKVVRGSLHHRVIIHALITMTFFWWWGNEIKKMLLLISFVCISSAMRYLKALIHLPVFDRVVAKQLQYLRIHLCQHSHNH